MLEKNKTSRNSKRSANQRLAAFISDVAKNHSSEALQRSRRAVLDTIGCMLIGIDEPIARNTLAAVSRWGCGTAPVVGMDITLPAPWAALVNGSSAKAFDYDDWDDQGLTHTTATLLPAILAMLDGRQASGLDLFDAHIIGVETIIRIGAAVNPEHYTRGWHATSTIGAIGATAACARVMGLDTEQTGSALSLATSMAGGSTTQFGTMAKPLHAGLAAKAGVLAATLATEGVTAHTDTLDGAISFASTMSDATQADFGQHLDKLGNPWGILEHGLHIKLYPSCGGTHRVIEAALELREAHSLKPDDIETVEINVSEFLCDLLPYGIPDNPTEALFSFPYCVAAALYWGQGGSRQFLPRAVDDKGVRQLAKRVLISSRHAPLRDRLFLEGDPDTVRVRTRSGELLSSSVDVPLGAPPRFVDDATVEHKFYECAAKTLSTRRAKRISELVFCRNSDWPLLELTSLLRKEQHQLPTDQPEEE